MSTSPEKASTIPPNFPILSKKADELNYIDLCGMPLPEDWPSLNEHLQTIYGPGPDFYLVCEHLQHIAELRQFIDANHPKKELLHKWVINIESTKPDIAYEMYIYDLFKKGLEHDENGQLVDISWTEKCEMFYEDFDFETY